MIVVRELVKRLRGNLRRHGKADTWVKTRVTRQELKALLDELDLLREANERLRTCGSCGSHVDADDAWCGCEPKQAECLRDAPDEAKRYAIAMDQAAEMIEQLKAEVLYLSKPGHDGLCTACGR